MGFIDTYHSSRSVIVVKSAQPRAVEQACAIQHDELSCGTMAANDITRRGALGGVLTFGCTVMITGCVRRRGGPDAARPSNQDPGDPIMTTPLALAGKHTMVPLPFAANSLQGISAELITSHHDNNYGSAVKNLNAVEKDLAQISKNTPPFIVHGLRERELNFRNSKMLHEYYFGNLGGDGQRSGAIDLALADAYDSAARWEEHMYATGMALGGGSGWVILALELDTGALRTYGSQRHNETLANSMPLLAMDMYEHAYQMDYAADVARYMDAFFANVNWDEVNRRFECAQQASALLRGNVK
jgi:Fe-Mn family superoxide dismutase